jgi:hypothetical protein
MESAKYTYASGFEATLAAAAGRYFIKYSI